MKEIIDSAKDQTFVNWAAEKIFNAFSEEDKDFFKENILGKEALFNYIFSVFSDLSSTYCAVTLYTVFTPSKSDTVGKITEAIKKLLQ